MLEYIEEKDKITVKFPPQIDTCECEKFEAELLKKINSASGKIMFDLADVAFICSEFIKICCMAQKKAGAENFSLKRLNPMIYKVFRVAGLTEIMHMG